MKKLAVMTAGLLLALSAITMGNQVGPPALTNVQGRLLDGSGNPVVDGNYNMIFSIWDRDVGGNQLWAETLSVPVAGGLFSAVLGQVHGVQPDFLKGVQPDFAPHLQTAVNGEVLSSRTRIVSNPYSGQASKVTGDIETGPGEIVFVGIGGAPDMPAGIVFQDTVTGDTIARYGPGEAVFTGVGGTPDVARYGLMKIDFLVNNPAQSGFIKIRDSDAAPDDGLVDFTEYSVAGIKYFDGTNDLTHYGPGAIVWVQPQPEPPLPAAAKVGSFGLVFGDVGPNHIRYGPSGIVMTDTTGDTLLGLQSNLMSFRNLGGLQSEHEVVEYGSKGIQFLRLIGNQLKPAAAARSTVIMFADTTGDTTVKLDASLGLDLGGSGSAKVRLRPAGMLMLDVSGDTTVEIDPNGKIELVPDDAIGTTVRLDVGGHALMVRGTMAGASTDVPTLIVRQSSSPTSTADVFRVQNNSGSTNLLRVASSGTVSAGGNVNVGGGLTAGGDISVGGGLTVNGTLSTSTDAGSSTVVAVGQRYRDNAIVAWGRVSATGVLSNDYGVASAVRNTTGSYTITLDASASLPGNLITTANVELDAAPTSAATARIIYVDQAPGSSSNSFNIYITNGSFAATDNDFMFICTAR